MFIGLTNFFDLSGPAALQPQKWLEIYKCQQTITPHQCTTIGFAGHKLASFMSRFPYFLETRCPYFEKYRRTFARPADFHTFLKLCVRILRNTGVLLHGQLISALIWANTGVLLHSQLISVLIWANTGVLLHGQLISVLIWANTRVLLHGQLISVLIWANTGGKVGLNH